MPIDFELVKRVIKEYEKDIEELKSKGDPWNLLEILERNLDYTRSLLKKENKNVKNKE